MDVILKEDVESLGQKGEVVHVATGYARNFLFPRSLAVAATGGNIKNLQHFMAAAEKKREAEREDARKVAEKLAELEIKIEARAGEKNRLFGSVTGQQIADVINAAMDLKLDKKKIAAGSGLKLLGKHKVMVTVYPGVTVEKEVEVVPSSAKASTSAEATADKPKGKPIAEEKAKKSAKTKAPKPKAAKKVKEEVASSGEIASSGEVASSEEIASSPKKQASRNDVSRNDVPRNDAKAEEAVAAAKEEETVEPETTESTEEVAETPTE